MKVVLKKETDGLEMNKKYRVKHIEFGKYEFEGVSETYDTDLFDIVEDKKMRYIYETWPLYFTNGKEYSVLGYAGHDHYSIVDDTGEDYMYTLDGFEGIE